MDARRRMMLIRLIEKIDLQPEYSNAIGVSVIHHFTKNEGDYHKGGFANE